MQTFMPDLLYLVSLPFSIEHSFSVFVAKFAVDMPFKALTLLRLKAINCLTSGLLLSNSLTMAMGL